MWVSVHWINFRHCSGFAGLNEAIIQSGQQLTKLIRLIGMNRALKNPLSKEYRVFMKFYDSVESARRVLGGTLFLPKI